MSAVTILDAWKSVMSAFCCLDREQDLHGEQLDRTATHTGYLQDYQI